MYAANELAKRTLGEWNGGINAGVAFTAGALSGYPESITCVCGVALPPLCASHAHGHARLLSGQCDSLSSGESAAPSSGAFGSVHQLCPVLPTSTLSWHPVYSMSVLTRGRPSMGQVLADEGLLAFTTGMGPTCWRNCVWNGVYFGLMHEVRKPCEAAMLCLVTHSDGPQVKGALPTPATRWGDLLQSLVVGFFAGIIATGFNAPFDVVKSRYGLLLGHHAATW